MSAYAEIFEGASPGLPVYLVEGSLEPGRVPVDQCLAQLRLAGEVVVECGLGHAQLGGDVGVAHAIETALLHQPLGDVEHAFCGVGNGALAGFHKSLSCPVEPS